MGKSVQTKSVKAVSVIFKARHSNGEEGCCDCEDCGDSPETLTGGGGRGRGEGQGGRGGGLKLVPMCFKMYQSVHNV